MSELCSFLGFASYYRHFYRQLLTDKCCFMRRVGVGGEGISTLEGKVRAVKDRPALTNLKSFIGLASYDRLAFLVQLHSRSACSRKKKTRTESPILTP